MLNIIMLTVLYFYLYHYWNKRRKEQQDKSLRWRSCAPPVEVTLIQKQIIAGLLFSDGHLRSTGKTTKSNYRLAFTFKIAVLNYCQWIKFVLLYGLCTESLTTPYPKDNPTQVWFSTRNHVYFTEPLLNVGIRKQRRVAPPLIKSSLRMII